MATLEGTGLPNLSATEGNDMQRFIRAAMLIVSVIGVITAIVKRFGPRVKEYSAASQAFWSNPRVIKARQKAWEQARRATQAEAKAARA